MAATTRKLGRRKQLNLIVNWFLGVPLDRTYTTDQFDDDLAAAWQIMQEYEQPAQGDWEDGNENHDWYWEMRREVQEYVTRYAQLHGIPSPWDQIKPHLEKPLTTYPSLAELAETLAPISWLWENWLPVGMLSMLAARPGTGKSLVALDLCRRIITGEAWPDGSAQSRPGAACIYVDAENVPAILNQRAQEWEQWGMDRRRIYPVIPEGDDDIVNLGDDEYRDLLWRMAWRIRPALIVVDSLRDILPAGENAVEDVRSTLAFLSNLATQNGCAMLVIHHLRKGQNGGQLALFDSIDLDQVSGSGYIGGRARVIMGLTKVQTGPKPDKNGPRKIEVIKTNLGEYPPDMGIVFERVPPDGLRLVWTEKAPERYQEPTERDEAAEWLLAYLAERGEPVRPREVMEAAAEAGFSRAMINRARKALQGEIVNTKGRQHPENEWALASDGAVEADDC